MVSGNAVKSFQKHVLAVAPPPGAGPPTNDFVFVGVMERLYRGRPRPRPPAVGQPRFASPLPTALIPASNLKLSS